MNLADRMVDIYAEGRHAAYMSDSRHTNPYPRDTAERHCWAHGWQDEIWEIESAIEELRQEGCYGAVVDGLGRVLAEALPTDMESAA